ALPPAAAAQAIARMSEGERSAPLKGALDGLKRGLSPDAGSHEKQPTSPGGAPSDPATAIASADPEVRLKAVPGLAARARSAEGSKGALRGAIGDDDERVRAAVAGALAAFKDEETFDALKQAFTRDGSATVRAAALRSIVQFSQREDLPEILGQALAEDAD